MKSIKEMVELEFIESKTPKELNDIFNKLNDRAKVAEQDRDIIEAKLIASEDKRKELLKGLRELSYDVFFKEDNCYPSNEKVVDVLWHDDYCTSFDNIAHLLGIDCSDANPEKWECDLKKLIEATNGK